MLAVIFLSFRPTERQRGKQVGVGIMVAHDPLHGSGRAVFPHPALASGSDGIAALGIGMRDAHRGQPTVNGPAHTVPPYTAVLTAPRQHVMPQPAHFRPKQVERRDIEGNTVIPDVPSDYRAQPRFKCWCELNFAPLPPFDKSDQRTAGAGGNGVKTSPFIRAFQIYSGPEHQGFWAEGGVSKTISTRPLLPRRIAR